MKTMRARMIASESHITELAGQNSADVKKAKSGTISPANTRINYFGAEKFSSKHLR